MMHLTKNIIKIVARVVNSCYLLAERVRKFTIPTQCRITGNPRVGGDLDGALEALNFEWKV